MDLEKIAKEISVLPPMDEDYYARLVVDGLAGMLVSTDPDSGMLTVKTVEKSVMMRDFTEITGVWLAEEKSGQLSGLGGNE